MVSESDYQQVLDYLYTFIDYSQTRSFRYSPDKFNLNRMNQLLNLLGNPHHQFPVIHVAGTKGKGSTSALVASALSACGHKAGFYTSPHLQEFRERIQIDGRLITKQQLIRLVEEMKPVIAQLEEPSFFEITTALAFWFFARQKVAIAVIEVGLGGRLDSTNVVNPMVTAITSISYDHMAVLGKTLTEIATEKAGIIKHGRPLILAPQKQEAAETIERIAIERGAKLVKMGADYRYAPWNHSLANQSLIIWKPEQQAQVDAWLEGGEKEALGPIQLTIPLLGLHQVENAATAFVVLTTAREEGMDISPEGIQKGFANVFWPGRFELIQKDPPVVIDSAHNRDSALKLRLAMDDYLSDRQIVLLFGALEDKDIEGMLVELLPRVSKIITTKSSHPRACTSSRLAQLVRQAGRPALTSENVGEGLDKALTLAGDQMAVVVAGSLSVSAEARDYLKNLGRPVKYFADDEIENSEVKDLI